MPSTGTYLYNTTPVPFRQVIVITGPDIVKPVHFMTLCAENIIIITRCVPGCSVICAYLKHLIPVLFAGIPGAHDMPTLARVVINYFPLDYRVSPRCCIAYRHDYICSPSPETGLRPVARLGLEGRGVLAEPVSMPDPLWPGASTTACPPGTISLG